MSVILCFQPKKTAVSARISTCSAEEFAGQKYLRSPFINVTSVLWQRQKIWTMDYAAQPSKNELTQKSLPLNREVSNRFNESLFLETAKFSP